MTDYTTSALVKSALSITDSSRDTAVAAKVTAASRAIDRMTGRTFQTDTSATARTLLPRVIARDGGQLLLTPDISSTTGLVIETGYLTGTTWTAVASTGYELQYETPLATAGPITGILRAYWGWALASSDRIRVTARWGWPSVPEDIGEATLILACRLFKRKDSPEGVAGSVDWGVMRVARVDPDVASLIAPYRQAGFA